MSQKYHTLHKRFTPQANTKHQQQCHVMRYDCQLHTTVRRIRQLHLFGDVMAPDWLSNQLSSLQILFQRINTTSSGCVTTLTAVVGRRRQQNYRQRSCDRLTTSLRECKNRADARRRDSSATHLRSSSILQYEQRGPCGRFHVWEHKSSLS
jgi:hypothetical protein